jgi:hypothetical protein
MLIVAYVSGCRDRRAPADDIGVIFLLVLCFYGTLPPAGQLLENGSFKETGFNRLSDLLPSADENITVLEIYVAAAIGFATVYLWKRRDVEYPSTKVNFIIASPIYKASLAVMLIGLSLNTTLMLMAGAHPTTYADSYRLINELPILLRQAMKISHGITNFVTLIVLVGLLQRLPKSWPFVVVYVTAGIASYDPEGARTGVVTALLALLIAWHVLVRPITTLAWLSMAVAGFLLFEIAGSARDQGSWHEAEISILPLHSAEADNLWANSIEMIRYASIGGSVPPAIRYQELYAFIPSQLLPFEKLSPSVWFVNEFDPATAQEGGGWVFGLAAQCVAGYGVAEGAMRGAILGLLAAWLMKEYRHAATWWTLPLYLYCITFSYKEVRGDSFELIADIIQFVIPSIIILSLISKARSAARVADAS